jgi:hypothetical protein
MMNGKDSVFSWSDGRKYEGGYKHDKKHGFGVFSWPGGKVYSGEWADGKQHGPGEIYNPTDGSVIKGMWDHGKFVDSTGNRVE